jgi:hypothetical protein
MNTIKGAINMKVHELLNSPDKWTQRASARDVNNHVCLSDSANAKCWCLLGAISKVYPCSDFMRVVKKVANVTKENIPSWNDRPERTFDDVRNLCLELDI